LGEGDLLARPTDHQQDAADLRQQRQTLGALTLQARLPLSEAGKRPILALKIRRWSMTERRKRKSMAQASEQIGKMTIAEFDAFVENVAEGKNFELFDGSPLLMNNPNETHEQIASNIGANLKLAMDKRGCRTYQGGMMVQASASSTGRDKFRPDVVVRCGPTGNNTFITDPVVVVEVLSPSTMGRDRGPKLAFYQSLPTVQHVVLAYSEQLRVEHFFRMETGWECKVLPTPESILELDAVEFSMDLDAIYFDVPFDKAPRPRVRTGGSEPKP
jgi:Uma2 family endonuclease